MEDFGADKIYFEQDGRAFKKIASTRYVPHYTFVHGKFRGKFHSDKLNSDSEKEEYYDFKIYEGEVEIISKSNLQQALSQNDENAVVIEPSQLPDKIYFFERNRNDKVYYKLDLKNPIFHNFKFIEHLQQNEDEEAFGTVEGEIYGHLIKMIPHASYKKLYRKINLIPRPASIEDIKKIVPETIISKNDTVKTPNGITPPPTRKITKCFRNLLLALGLIIFSLIIGFTPTFIIGLVWLFYVLFKCYFNWLKYLFYLFCFLFLIGLVYSIMNINWNSQKQPFIPKVEKNRNTKTELVKLIKLVDEKSNKEDLLIKRKMEWLGYNGEKYSGEYSIKKSDLDLSRSFKNKIPYTISYSELLSQLSYHDTNRLNSLYTMFDQVKANQPMDDKRFAEMIVSFVQNIPYYLVLDKSCNAEDYQDPSIKQILQENPGMCTPNQKFGITTPIEFMANLQGDCDSRTVLLYTILKHYNYDVAIFSSDIYKHSILGINIPYSGIKFPFAGKQYTLWETTSINKPGALPQQITNLDYWDLSLK